jgi:hypothetical protein
MTFPYPYVGPISLYNNLPINANFYEPSQFFISDITNGITTLVTTTVDHNYSIGQLCRLIIPIANVERQLNEQSGYVISIPADNQVILDINSVGYDIFVTSSQPTQPQILAIGDGNSGNINASGNLITSTSIPGSYINISPS